MAAWMRDTNAHGFGQCQRSRSRLAKLLWAVFICCCLTLATLHVILLVIKYTDYPTTISLKQAPLPAKLPDPVVCSTDLLSTFRLKKINRTEWNSLQHLVGKLWNESMQLAQDEDNVSYLMHFKRLLHRLPQMQQLMPQAQDLVVGFGYSSAVSGSYEEFLPFLADVNEQMQICFRLRVATALSSRGLSNRSFSRNSLQLLLYKRPKSSFELQNLRLLMQHTSWSWNSSLPLLLDQASDDSLRLYLVNEGDPINSAQSLSRGMLLTYGNHYDVQVLLSDYKVDASNLKCDSERYKVRDVIDNFTARGGASICQQRACAAQIAASHRCSYCGILQFKEFSDRLPDCCSVNSSQFIHQLRQLKQLSDHMRTNSVCNGSSSSVCSIACKQWQLQIDADSYSWPYLSATGFGNFSSEIRMLEYLQVVLRQFARKFLKNNLTALSEIADAFPLEQKLDPSSDLYFIRVSISFITDFSQSYTTSRKFELQDFLSDFGGAIGVWVGASFLTTGELLILIMSLSHLIIKYFRSYTAGDDAAAPVGKQMHERGKT